MEQNAKKKISCGGFMLGEGLVLSEDGKTLSVSGGGGLPSGGTFYQRLVTDENGNARWATVNSVIYRGIDGNLSVDSCMEIDGYPESTENMIRYGSISLVDDVNGTYSPCISVCSTGSGYDILTFMSIGESSSKMIKIKVVDGVLADDKISIADEISIFEQK